MSRRARFNWGFIAPILLVWFLLGWVIGATVWADGLRNSDFQTAVWWVVGFWWLVIAPASGFAAGLVHGIFVCEPFFDGPTRQRYAVNCQWLLAVCNSPVLAYGFCCCGVSFLIMLLFHLGFYEGQKKAFAWTQSGFLDKYFGQKNDWEREVKRDE